MTSSAAIKEPELYWTTPTPHSPNSKLPVLVYRSVLPDDLSIESLKKVFQSNQWDTYEERVFKHYPTAHFHSNSHECYAAIRGSTKCCYGVGPLDDSSAGVTFEMKAGDVAVHAAGVVHRNVESSSDYAYVGIYPRGAPHWDNNFCKADAEETASKVKAAQQVSVPDFDPIYGLDGPLPKIWRSVG